MNDVFLKSRAVERLCPGKMFVYRNGIFEWNDEGEPPTEAEIDAEVVAVKADYYYEELRKKRNQLLAETDWTQSRDVTLPNDSEWATYRQALRDLPANTEDPANPVWPTKPE